MYNGVINIYKEAGFTSHDVVAKLRGIAKQKKIGHTGTLDPEAEGVLAVCLGSATRICDMLTNETKEYEAVLLLGVTTDTQDTTGNIISEAEVNVSEESLREAVSCFIGEIAQIPPMYSALKVGGKKLYELARAGVEVERKPRNITIYGIEICDISFPRVKLRVICSKGTYIRTLCHDIGEKLGCGGAMERLLRTSSGSFTLDKAYTLEEVQKYADEGRMSDIIIPLSEIFSELKVGITDDRAGLMAQNGNRLMPENLCIKDGDGIITEPTDKMQIRVVSPDGFFYGIYIYDKSEKSFKPVKMFLC